MQLVCPSSSWNVPAAHLVHASCCSAVATPCAAGTYVAEWSLDMDLGTGELRKMPGISVLRFVQPDASSAGDDASSEEANLVAYHRDYLPDGKIWENAPVVGPLVKFQRETYQSCMLSPKGCVDLLGAPK